MTSDEIVPGFTAYAEAGHDLKGAYVHLRMRADGKDLAVVLKTEDWERLSDVLDEARRYQQYINRLASQRHSLDIP